VDASRANREVPVRIRIPTGTGAVPLILFSHGLGGSLDGGKDWVEHWAAAGFAVINLQHPGSDRAIIGTGGFLKAMNATQLEARARDVSFVLDRVASKKREGPCDLTRIDLRRIGMSGHSFGAHTTQAIAGQRFPGINLADRRVDAAIAFSPAAPANGSADTAFHDIGIPFFSVTGSEDKVIFLPQLTPEQRELPFRSMPPGGKYLLVLKGADHMDMGGPDGEGRNRLMARLRRHSEADRARERQMADIIAQATTDFWRWTLLEDSAAKARLDSTPQHLPAGDRFASK
jgi:predicted dienelactone hydrolase